MRNGFQNMREFYDSLVELIDFPIYALMYIMLFINVYILITFYFYACRWNMEIWNEIKSINKTFLITQEEYPLKMMK